MSHSWMRGLCRVAVVVAVMMGWGCKKSKSGVATADAGPMRSEVRSLSAKPGVALRPAKRRWVSRARSGGLSEEVNHLNSTLNLIHKMYQKAYKGGQIRDWTSFLQAKKLLKQAQAMEKHMGAKLRKKNPSLARKVRWVVAKTSKIMGSKSHPQRLGLLRYQLMLQTKTIEPALKATLLTQYRVTVKQAESSFVAYGQSGAYRVGVELKQPRSYYRWYEVRRNDHKSRVRLNRRASHMVVVHLLDAKTGSPLGGTDVSLEILDAKTGRQLATHKMDPMWTGRPVFVHNLVLPKKAKNIKFQVSISALPWNRTQPALRLMRSKGVVQFAAQVKSGKVSFVKPKKKLQLKPFPEMKLGVDVLKAVAATGGTILETPIHRIGLALLPTNGLYLWRRGSLKWKKTKKYFNTQVVAIVQDKKTGLLVPNARIQLFYKWIEKDGSKYEFQKYLKPVYGDGFPSLRTVIRMKPTNYTLRVRVDAPLSASFSRVRFPSYSAEIKDFRPPLK